MNATQGMEDFSRTHISVIGAEDNFGANAMDQSKLPREAVVWMGVAHGDRRAIDIWCVLPSVLFGMSFNDLRVWLWSSINWK